MDIEPLADSFMFLVVFAFNASNCISAGLWK